MLRLITSRRVRLALAAGLLAAVVVLVVRLWRRPEGGPGGDSPIKKASIGSSAEKTDSGAGHAPRRPPAPLLGVPTEEDLRRYATGPPSAFRSAFERTFAPRPPHEPLDGAVKGRLVRWGAVGIGLCLLAFGTAQVLENAVFSNRTETVEATDLRNQPGADGRCGPEPDVPPEPGARYPAEGEPTAGLDVVVCRNGVPEASEAQELFKAVQEGPDTARMYPDMEQPLYPVESARPYEPPAPEETPEAVPDADCRPQARASRVRVIDPRMTRAVNRQWRRIERWLAANAPESLRTLGRPARARTIAVAEAQMGLRFPDDLRASLLRHDGARVVGDTWPFGFIGNRNQGVREIRDTWRRLCGMDGEDIGAAAGVDARAERWDGRMIPFGANGGGDHLVIDSVARGVGRTDHEGQMSFTPGGIRIRSYYGLLKATADALETGGSVGHWKPRVTGGELDWDVVRS
ncbi:SMI1/KNR4 family protein [Streptosporangium sp. NPDC049644]|uniref:SMI1/KNR4 family protein n=1 Tax=Streptosporangium sp. NPDC049644 TaxID=3155507 RepID=UPI00341C2A8C